MDRCSKCIMPTSARGIQLDDRGHCQFCRTHTEYTPLGKAKLREEIEPYRTDGGWYNCIVPVSGGRDSAFALYYAVKVLELSPIAVHSDNDFVTGAATRNLETMTSRLRVPLVNVGGKSGLARKIVAEKVKMNAPYGPSLVVDQICEPCQIGFESAAYNVARKNGIRLIIWGDSKGESTVKYRSLIPHEVPTLMQRCLSPRLVNLLAYKHYLTRMEKEYGPHSNFGTKQLHLYDYIEWDPDLIVRTIERELGWSAPPESATTWRIDCSLVPLVNYLTEKAYGVGKIELGFSNMVRSGKMDRASAIEQANKIKSVTDVETLNRFLTDLGISPSDAARVLGGRSHRVQRAPVPSPAGSLPA